MKHVKVSKAVLSRRNGIVRCTRCGREIGLGEVYYRGSACATRVYCKSCYKNLEI